MKCIRCKKREATRQSKKIKNINLLCEKCANKELDSKEIMDFFRGFKTS